MNSAEQMGRDEGRDLRDAIRELTAEFRGFRAEAAQTFVRQDTHQRDLQLLVESHNKDVQLLTQTLTALQQNTDTRMETESKRVDKIEGDGDWLKKIIYSVIIVAVLAAVGLSGAATAGVFR